MPFYEIEFPLAGLEPDAVVAALAQAGACSTTFQDMRDDPVLEPKPGEMRLWRETLVRALFDDAHDPARCLNVLGSSLGPETAAAMRLRPVPERIWEREWMQDWKPLQFGAHLWVCPTSAEPPADPDAVIVRLDPGLAFGTGTHATTALCLEALASLDLRGKSVIDYGCGSGILAIAALKLGAAAAVGVDLDPQALTASRQNALQNGVAARLATAGAAEPFSPADCVLANILAGTLIELLPTLSGACTPGGDLLLSGILVAQQESVVAAYRRRFDIVSVSQRDDWCCIHARRRPLP